MSEKLEISAVREVLGENLSRKNCLLVSSHLVLHQCLRLLWVLYACFNDVCYTLKHHEHFVEYALSYLVYWCRVHDVGNATWVCMSTRVILQCLKSADHRPVQSNIM